MAQSRAESTRDTYNYGQYINQFPPNTIKVIREFERVQKKICRQKMSIMFNEICINEEMLPKYTDTHAHTHTHTYIYIHISLNHLKLIRMWYKINFKRIFKLVLIHSFHSRRLVAKLDLPISGERTDGFLPFLRASGKLNYPSPEFELLSLNPFSTMVTVTVCSTL